MADNPFGTKFDVNRKALSLCPFVASFKKISLKSDLYIFFQSFYTCILPQGRGRQPLGDKILMPTERPYHFAHLLQVLKKIAVKSDFIHIFHAFIHVYSPRAGADNPLGTKF